MWVCPSNQADDATLLPVPGGISLRSLMPGWSFTCWRALENSALHDQTRNVCLALRAAKGE
jgi:hypothetical protein